MNKPTPVLLAPLFLLLATFIAGAQNVAPAWHPAGTYFVTNSTPVVGGTNVFSVITADVNGDGKPDLICLSSNTVSFPGNLTVFTNNGSGFGSNATYAVGSASSVTVADVNGDGYVDLICTITNGTLNGTVLVLTNNGTGVFGSNATYTVGVDPTGLTAAATTTSGSVDLIIANYNSGNSPYTLTVLTNNGAGIFVFNTTYNMNSPTRSVVAADVNGDGHVDLVSLNYLSGSLTVLTNNGGGKFVTSGTFTVGNSPSSVAVADVNGDGQPDLIVASYTGSTSALTILTNAGGGFGKFVAAPAPSLGANLYPYFVTAVTNLDGRGLMALITANSGNGSGQNSGSTLTVLTNNGTGVFGSNATLHVGNVPESIAVADFNGDGRPDLAAADAGTNTLTVLFNSTIFYNTTFTVGSYGSLGVTATGLPVPALSISNSPPLPSGVTFPATTNGAGTLGGTPAIGSGGIYNLFLLASNNFAGPTVVTQKVAVTINQQPIFPGGVLMTNNFVVGNEPYSVAVADVNGDGKPDLISANYNNGSSFGVGGTLTVLTNDGFGGFGSNTSYTVGIGPRCVIAVTNIDGHGLLALVSANFNSGQASTLTVLTNSGGGIFVSNTAYSTCQSGEPISVTAADVNGDGYVDLIAANYGNNSLTVFTNNGSGGFKAASTNSVGTEPDCVIAADLLGNGKVDLICANYNSDSSLGGTLSVLTNNGTGVFTLSSSPAVGQGPMSVVAADIYGNGKLALVSANYGNNNIGSLTVLTNNGKGVFGSNATFQVNSAPGVAAADVNCDGKVDLVFAQVYSTENAYWVGVLTNNGSGVFGNSPGLFYPNNNIRPYSIVAADVNGDGRPDFITANYYNNGGNTVTVLTNAANTTAYFLEGSTGAFNTAASGYPAPGFSQTGALPGGITFNNGSFSGTPTDGMVEVFSNVLVTATNAIGTNTENLTLIGILGTLVANPYATNTAENTSLRINFSSLLAGDSDPNGSYNLNIYSVNPTSTNGGSVQNDGTYANYIPATGFAGQDAFTYTLTDSLGLTTQGTVSVTVNPQIIPGIVTVSTAQSTALVVPSSSLLVNDVDLKGYALSLTAVSATSTNGGTVALSGGNVTYTPVTAFTGADQFTYTMSDGHSATAQGTVQVIVTRPGSPAYNNMAISPPNGNQLSVAFTGQPNQTYYLLSATNVTGPYAEVAGPIMADQNGLVTNTITMLPGTPSQFYRVSSMP